MQQPRSIRWFHQLRWRLSLLYTSVTVVLILLVIGIGEIHGYLRPRALYRPEVIAPSLAENAWQLVPYLSSTCHPDPIKKD